MPKGKNNKYKLYRLANIMIRRTDEDHFLTMPEIQKALEAEEVTADRKTLYNDLKDLAELGVEVEGEQWGNSYRYHVVSNAFEPAEMKLLVDAIQSSKFITPSKTAELIKKLEGFVSEYNAKRLQRQVIVSGRVKTMNKSVFYTIDVIHSAIADDLQISFKYFSFDRNKAMVFHHRGKSYKVSPLGLVWNNENYYLVAYDHEENKRKHFRVDKMTGTELLPEKRSVPEIEASLNLADYSKQSFGMFGGKEESVRLIVKNYLANVILDRFGMETMLFPVDEEHFSVNVKVQLSSQFYGWIFALSDGVKVAGPDYVVEKVKEELDTIRKLYS